MHTYPQLLIATALLFLKNSTVNTHPDARLLGNTDAQDDQFPSAAAIQVQTANEEFFCGGTLMRHRWVLTAGQCVYNATLFTIQLGFVSLTDPDSDGITVTSSEYFLHPNFDFVTLEANLGIIKLEMNSMIFSSGFFVPIIPVSYSPLVVLKWVESEYSDHLQYAEMSSLRNDECKEVYGYEITDDMVCVAAEENEEECTGDIGGALLRADMSEYYVVAVASFINLDGCDYSHPWIFTRVSPYYGWLDSTMTSE